VAQISPEWHGWLHYVHDKTGPQLAAEFEKPFKQPHKLNQAMLRPGYAREGLDEPVALGVHQPPGSYALRVTRGRVGPKYEAWSGSPTLANPEVRNCVCCALVLTAPHSLRTLRLRCADL
jgi:NADH:ubiquinone oxidoreductase subunit